ncbi:MAG: hypothetical protein ACO3QN_03735 [Bacilli bacterium]
MLTKIKSRLKLLQTYPMESLILIFVFGLAIWLRFSLTDWVSGDYQNFIRPWLNQIVANGGIASLGMRIGDYTPPYVYLLTLISYFPDASSNEPFLFGVKMISLLFDLLLALAVLLNAKIWLKHQHPLLPVMLAIITLFLPTVIINGAIWGQIDASYTAFSLFALYYLQKDQPFKSAIWYGIAISFKLQAIFFLPVFIVYFWFHFPKKIYYVGLLPLLYYGLALPALIAGRSLADITNIYVLQTQTYPLMTLNMPNLYQWFANNRYQALSPVAISLFTAIMGFQFFMMLIKKIALKKEQILLFTYWSILVANFFLPAMHERYLYAADIIVILLVFQHGKKFYLVGLTQLISLLAYAPFIFGQTPIPLPQVAVGFAVMLTLVSYWLWQPMFTPERIKE